MKQITSEMAGIVSSVLVEEGVSIQKGQEVCVIESMKMQIPVESELAGVVKEIKVKPGDFINEGDVLLTCE
jgi:acetyl-CoA carboxylase biotin carboxyl carrier protein